MATLHNVLWTSGWDSTFRVAQLLLMSDAVVQPWYVVDPDRYSSGTELRTMERIRLTLEQRDPSIHDRLKPTKVIDKADVPVDAEITGWFSDLRRSDYWGAQYDWLARLAKSEGVRLEIGLKSDDAPSVRLGDLVVKTDTPGRYGFDLESASGPKRLFQYFEFPIYDITKLESQQIAQANGYLDVMEMTWWCHTPLFNGQPCGWCNPCKHARAEGFGRRVPAPSLGKRLQYLLITKSRSLKRKLSSI